MQSRLSIYCDKIIEAGWLAAVVVAPLFFNINSSRIFDPEKTVLIRSIALVMFSAWLIGRMEDRKWRGDRLRSTLQQPLSIAIIAFAAIYIVSTIVSIMPRVSLGGAYLRRQGTYAVLSYIVVALLTAHTLRHTAQLQRFITTVILTSWIVALYGIIQHYYLDPVEWHGDTEKRVISTIGNPIFFGAYLIMVIPLTAMRVIKNAQRLIAAWRGGENGISRFRWLLPLGLYTLILASQVLATIFTKSRGPFVGMLGGTFVFLLLWAATRQRALVWTLLALAVEIGLLLLILNLPNTPFPEVARTKYGRLLVFGSGMNVGSGRLLIWQGAIDMLKDNLFRALLGYGPETMFVAYTPFLRAELFDYIGFGSTPDHAHNEMYDILVSMGIIGGIAYLVLFGSAFYRGFRNLKLIRAARDRYLFAGLWMGGGVGGLLIASILSGGLKLVGLTVPVGAMAGMILYIVIHNLLARELPPADEKHLLVIAIIAALFSHFMESQFGISLSSALTLLWLYIALLFVTERDLNGEPAQAPDAVEEPEQETPSKRSKRRRKKRSAQKETAPRTSLSLPWNATAATYALLSGLTISILLHDFLFQAEFAYSLLGLFALAWLIWGIITLHETNYQWRSFALYAALSLGSAGLFALVYAPLARNPLRLDRGILVFFCFLGIYLLAMGGALLGKISLPARNTRFSGALTVYPFLLIAAILVIFFTNLRVVQADIFYKGASIFDKAGRYDESIQFYQKAVKRAPTQPHYYVYLGRAYAAKASATTGEQRARWIQLADEALRRAHELSPRSPDYVANLADLTHNWAKIITAPEERAAKIQEALDYYNLTLELAPQIYAEQLRPNIANAHFMLGEIYRQREQHEQAIVEYLKAVELAPESEEIHRSLVVEYWLTEQIDKALEHAYIARDLATGETRENIIAAIEQLETVKNQGSE